MLNMSPTSLVVSLQQLRQGATLDLGEVLKMEYRISQVMMQRKDFYEGIRAVLVDRDNAPVWGSTDHIAPYFASLGDLELQLPAKVADPAVNAGLVSQVEVEAALKSGGLWAVYVSPSPAFSRLVWVQARMSRSRWAHAPRSRATTRNLPR